MTRVAASLAAVALALGLTACGGDGAEPGASEEATLVLDFTPNAVHAGIYAALAEGYYADEGIELEVREPSASTDAPKLLAAGRADFAVMDINDVAIAHERGFAIVAVAPIVQRPLATVIAREEIGRPRDLAGGLVGVTGLPSDDAVLDAVLDAGGVDPSDVERITIGFDSVAALAAGRVDAATAFWNAEGVALERRGVPTTEFRVDDFGAPRYPELVLVTSARSAAAAAVAEATAEGYELVVSDPAAGLDALLAANPGLDHAEQHAQLEALLQADAFSPPGRWPPPELSRWVRWASAHGVFDASVTAGQLVAR
jgi:putative hydroxymethylpyrimidine transport system substrate-binding protein